MPPLTATSCTACKMGWIKLLSSFSKMPLCKIGRVQLRTWLQQTIWSFRRKKKKPTATNKNRTDGEAVSQEKKLKSLWVCFDRQQEGLRQRRRWQKRNNVNLSNSAVKLLQEKKILSISGEWLLHLLLNWTLSVVLPLQLTLKLTLKKTPRFPVPIPAG